MIDLAQDVLTPARHLEHVAADVASIAAGFVRKSVGRAAATATATKSTPTDVVTATDIASEKLIRSELLSRCPGSAMVGEELDDKVGYNDIGWIIDPIDGTVNFLYDLPVVSVSIAATIDGTVVAGAVADILRKEVFTATAGEGARRDGAAIGVSATTKLGQSLIGTGFAYDKERRAEQAQTLLGVLPACRDIRCMGSAALNLCWVGCGRLEAYFENDIKLYDYAAGALIAAEAGARVKLPGSVPADDLTMAATPAIFVSLTELVS